MTLLLAGLAGFFAVHVLPAIPGARAALAGRFGEKGYIGLFSVLSLATFVFLIWSYATSPLVAIWAPPAWTRLVAAMLMPAALIILMSSFFPGRIKERLKHPILVSVKIWAVAHLLANGDLASMLLFGGFLAYAVINRILLKKREEYAPFQSGGGARNDMIAVIAGLAISAALILGLHEWLIGVPVLV